MDMELEEIIQRIIKQIKLTKGNSREDYYAEKTRLTKAQADRTEVELEEKQGNLLDSEETIKAWSAYVTATRARLLSIPTKCAQELAGADEPTIIKGILEELICEALEELSGKEFIQRVASSGEGN